MPAVMPKRDQAPVLAARVQERLAEAAWRIRVNDLLAGILFLLAITLGYMMTVMALDRWLTLPDWARQVGLVAFLGAAAYVTYRMLYRPFRQMINPLYAAKLVERTIPDAKNSVVSYVDLADAPIPESIRQAIGSSAAKTVDRAPINEAVDTRAITRAGIAVGVLLVSLAIFFLIVRPTQFSSLMGRAITPFSAGAIASRTEITIVQPEGGDAVLTAGQPFEVAVTVQGRLPQPGTTEQLQLQIRYHPDDPNSEAIPLEQGASNREWQVRVPDYLVRNGFWYTITGGDGTTPQHRVEVRSRPLFTGFEARYEYPEYLNLLPEIVPEPQLEAYRGTRVTLTARTNRSLKNARLIVTGQEQQPLPGEIVGTDRQQARFQFTLENTGTYRLQFEATSGERNADSPAYPIRVISDQPPLISIVQPEQEEITLPANGTLAIDANIGDDFGIDTATLRLRLAGEQPKPLQPLPYRNGESFRRDSDGTYPTSLEYKDSVRLGDLKDEAGNAVTLSEGMVLEYWLEATDNCTVPAANIGRSRVQRVKLTTPELPPEQKQAQEQAAQAREQQEQAHQQKQTAQLENEQRKPPAQPRPNAVDPAARKPEEKTPPPQKQGEPGDTQPTPQDKPQQQPDKTQPKEGTPSSEQGAQGEPGKQGQPGQQGQPSTPETAPEPAKPDPQTDPKGANGEQQQPQPGTQPGATQPGTDTKSGATDQQDPQAAVKEEARKIEEALKKQENQPPATARTGAEQPAPQEQPAPAAERKSGPPEGTGAEPRPQQKGEQPSTPPEEKPEPVGSRPSEPKPMETGDKSPMGGEPQPGSARDDKPSKPSETKPAPDSEPKTGERSAQGPPAESKDTTGQPSGPGAEAKPDQSRAGAGSKTGEKQASAKEMEQTVRDLASGDEERQQAARERMEQSMGPEQRQKAEDIAKGLQSQDEKTRAKAEDDLRRETERLSRENVRQDPKGQSDDDVERLFRDAKDLNSPDDQKRQQAEQNLDRSLGQDARKDLQERMKNTQANNQPMEEEKIKDDIDQLRKKKKKEEQAQQAGDPNQGNQGTEKSSAKGSPEQQPAGQQPTGQQAQSEQKPSPADQKAMEQALQDMMSNDPERQKAGREKIDQMVGKETREQAEQMAKDLQSDDPATRKAAQDKLNQMAEQAKAQQQQGKPEQQGLTPEQKQELQQAAKDLNSDDPQKQQAARDKIDQMVGKETREQAEQMAKDLQSDDPATRKAAQDKLNQMAEQAKAQQQQGQPQQGLTPEQKQELQQAAKDLNSDDPQKQQAARDKIDQLAGKETREQAEQMAKDLQSDDPATRKAAQDKLNQMAEQAKAQQQQGKPEQQGLTPEQKQELQQAAKDLNSEDPQKQQAARDKIDQMVGKETRQQAEQMAKDLQSDDPATRKAAQDKLNQMAEQAKAQQQQGKPEQQGLSPEEKQKLQDVAKNLGSDDPEAQKKAAEDFSKSQLGQDLAQGLAEQAEQLKKQGDKPDPQKALEAAKNLADLQKQMEDLKSKDPEKAEKALENLRDLANRMKKQQPPGPPGEGSEAIGRGPGGSPDSPATPLDENKEFGKLPSELQLETLKKQKGNKALLDQLGYTEADYERFLKGFEEVVQQERAQVEEQRRAAETQDPKIPRVNVSEATGRVESRTDGTQGNPQSTGPAFAPPGYSDALKKFAEQKQKRQREQQK